jgi:hypothetical protein
MKAALLKRLEHLEQVHTAEDGRPDYSSPEDLHPVKHPRLLPILQRVLTRVPRHREFRCKWRPARHPG